MVEILNVKYAICTNINYHIYLIGMFCLHKRCNLHSNQFTFIFSWCEMIQTIYSNYCIKLHIHLKNCQNQAFLWTSKNKDQFQLWWFGNGWWANKRLQLTAKLKPTHIVNCKNRKMFQINATVRLTVYSKNNVHAFIVYISIWTKKNMNTIQLKVHFCNW